MNGLKSIALGFCAAAVFLGALSFLAPSGNMKKSVKYAFSLVFLVFCIGLFAVFGKVTKIECEIPETAVKTSGADTYAAYLCGAVMKDADLSYKKITANTNINENGDIYINELRIETAEPPERVKQAVESKLEVVKLEVVNE